LDKQIPKLLVELVVGGVVAVAALVTITSGFGLGRPWFWAGIVAAVSAVVVGKFVPQEKLTIAVGVCVVFAAAIAWLVADDVTLTRKARRADAQLSATRSARRTEESVERAKTYTSNTYTYYVYAGEEDPTDPSGGLPSANTAYIFLAPDMTQPNPDVTPLTLGAFKLSVRCRPDLTSSALGIAFS
jgi:hypothetical protein